MATFETRYALAEEADVGDTVTLVYESNKSGNNIGVEGELTEHATEWTTILSVGGSYYRVMGGYIADRDAGDVVKETGGGRYKVGTVSHWQVDD